MSAREPFKPGDRVRVYLGPTRRPITGKIEEIHGNGRAVYVIEDGFYSCHSESPFDAKWCRRLRKRKRERRQWTGTWQIRVHPDGIRMDRVFVPAQAIADLPDAGTDMTLIEVKRGPKC